jgi:molybdopterin molybdotransferase
VTPLSFDQARACVLERVRAAGVRGPTEMVPLAEAAGRVLAGEVRADRDYPPQARSTRDGFAVRAAEFAIGPGEAAEIMTGAPLPAGADAVIMVEHVERAGERVRANRPGVADTATRMSASVLGFRNSMPDPRVTSLGHLTTWAFSRGAPFAPPAATPR